MAVSNAIALVGEAVVGLLHDASRMPPDLGFGNCQFAVQSIRELQKSPPDDGAALYLYRLEVSGLGRNRTPRLRPDGRRMRPSLYLDLHYALSVWADTAARQQRLLGWCMRTLDDATLLTSGLLNRNPAEDGSFDPGETVELVPEPLSAQDLVNIWEPLTPLIPLTVGYVARTVALDSAVPLGEGPPVLVRRLTCGVVEDAP